MSNSPAYHYGGIPGAASRFNGPAQTVLLCEIGPGSDAAHTGSRVNLTNPAEASADGENSENSQGTVTVSNTAGSGGQALLGTGLMGRMFAFLIPFLRASTRRQSDGSNFLLPDSHIKWLRGSPVFTGTTSPSPPGCTSTEPTNQDLAGTGLYSPVAVGTQSSRNWAATFSPIQSVGGSSRRELARLRSRHL